MLKRIIRRAREAAKKHLPDEVRTAGRNLAAGVLERVPGRVRATLEPLLDDTEDARGTAENAAEARPSAHEARTTEIHDLDTPPPDAAEHAAAGGTRPAASRGGWAPAEGGVRGDEYRVVVFGAPDDDASQRASAVLAREGVEHRVVDLRREPRTAQQLAAVTGVMQPPYVYIDGRHWGNDSALESLSALGDLAKILARKIDEVSAEGRRIGGVHESFDDAITIENIVDRLRRGHILTVDGLDCWLEIERRASRAASRVFFEGIPRPADQLEAVAREIATRFEADPDIEVLWRFEPAVEL